MLQATPDVLTADDLARRQEFPWVQPSRAELERLSYGEQGPGDSAPRRRLPLLARSSGGA